ncbi:MAG: 3-deoxy-8-phosphooctulonate synthase [Opitutales bacterium]|nr:3-deoxy-8-phosphooctulonate synthase [Opitutales bacterium]
MLLFQENKLLLIAGPCSLENAGVTMAVAKVLADLQRAEPDLFCVFKGSFDKANRTSATSPRGPGLEEGLALLAEVKESFGFPLLTDFHQPDQAATVASVCDVLQIPAFLCRQTDLLEAAAATGRVVNVKKGQFLSPGEMRHVVRKLESANAREIWQTERGTTFGYNNLVVDMRSFPTLRANNHPVVFDATHSVQQPGGGDGSTSGDRRFVPTLARAALAAGAQGLFIETHPDPDRAISDGPNQVPLADFPELIHAALRVWRAVGD